MTKGPEGVDSLDIEGWIIYTHARKVPCRVGPGQGREERERLLECSGREESKASESQVKDEGRDPKSNVRSAEGFSVTART